MSTSGWYLESSWDAQYIGGISWFRWGSKLIKAFDLYWKPRCTHSIPPMYSWYPTHVLMVSHPCTHGIPLMYSWGINLHQRTGCFKKMYPILKLKFWLANNLYIKFYYFATILNTCKSLLIPQRMIFVNWKHSYSSFSEHLDFVQHENSMKFSLLNCHLLFFVSMTFLHSLYFFHGRMFFCHCTYEPLSLSKQLLVLFFSIFLSVLIFLDET